MFGFVFIPELANKKTNVGFVLSRLWQWKSESAEISQELCFVIKNDVQTQNKEIVFLLCLNTKRLHLNRHNRLKIKKKQS